MEKIKIDLMSKDEFVNTMNWLQTLDEEASAINRAYQNAKFFSLDISFGEYQDLILEILENMFDDANIGWINYYYYELDFGKNYKDGCITQNDKNISLRNASDLYDILINNIIERNK